MRGLQYYSDDDIMVMHLLKAHSIASTVKYIRALTAQQHRYVSGNFREIERVGQRLEGYGEDIALSRYGLRHFNLPGIEPHLEATRVAFDGVIRFVHERTMQIMPASLSPEQKVHRLLDMMFPDRQVRQ